MRFRDCSDRYIVNELLRSSRHRSDVTTYLRQVGADYGLGRSVERTQESIDLVTLDSWYSMGRHVAFGRQYQADVALSFQSDRPMTGELDFAMQRISTRRQAADFVAPDAIFHGLAAMSSEDFGRFTYEAREKLRAVWRRSELQDVRRLLEDLERRVRGQDKPGWKFETFGAVALVAGAVSAPVLAHAGRPDTALASVVSAAFAAVAAGQALPKVAKIRRSRRDFKRAVQYLHEHRRLR